MPESVELQGLFIGQPQPLLPEGQPSSIVKQPVLAVEIGPEGLQGDRQADRRVHGGPEKAVHHFAAENYATLSRLRPQAAALFVPGSIGENLSTTGFNESNVCIGDRFQIGDCVLEVSQPRSPCWKIDRRFGLDRLSRLVQDERICGWYYRVLQPGRVAVGDRMLRVARGAGMVGLREFWDIYLQHRPAIESLAHLLEAEALNPQWRKRLEDRLQWLRDQGSAGQAPV